jgi:hypothetical protein
VAGSTICQTLNDSIILAPEVRSLAANVKSIKYLAYQPYPTILFGAVQFLNHISRTTSFNKLTTWNFTIRVLAPLLFAVLTYLSMSFLTKLFRPFTTMSNAPATPANVPAGAHTATVAAGCFWGVEHMYRRQFEKKGLYDARVGYIGGDSKDPGYRAVCSGRSGRTCEIRRNGSQTKICANNFLQTPKPSKSTTTPNK